MGRKLNQILPGDTAAFTYVNIHGATIRVSGEVVEVHANGICIMDDSGATHDAKWTSISGETFKHTAQPVNDPNRYDGTLL